MPTTRTLEFDLLVYSYAGHVRCLAARLYQGQTTNLHTPGGGVAPVESTVGGPAALPRNADHRTDLTGAPRDFC